MKTLPLKIAGILFLIWGMFAPVSYANDDVKFGVIAADGVSLEPTSLNNNGGLNPSITPLGSATTGTVWFSVTNVYDSGDVDNQSQSGAMNVYYGNALVCTINWTHTFTKSGNDKHDRFLVDISNPDHCHVSGDNPIHDSGHKVSITYTAGVAMPAA